VKHLPLAALLTVGCFGAAFAEENVSYTCQHGSDVRAFAVEYAPATGGARSCRILYKRAAASADPAKELWHFETHAEKCAAQSDWFRKRLEGLGLACAVDGTRSAKQ
jgi:hypothetical protein